VFSCQPLVRRLAHQSVAPSALKQVEPGRGAVDQGHATHQLLVAIDRATSDMRASISWNTDQLDMGGRNVEMPHQTRGQSPAPYSRSTRSRPKNSDEGRHHNAVRLHAIVST